jgi:hypothetical protein
MEAWMCRSTFPGRRHKLEVSGELHALAALPAGTGGWALPRAGLDDVEKRKFLTLPELELQLLCRPVRKQSLYGLRYPGSSGLCQVTLLYVFTSYTVFR